MTTAFLKILAVCVFSFTLLGCSTSAPIKDVNAATINHQLSHEQIRMAIIEAGAQRGWVMSNYNRWVNNLRHDIQMTIQVKALQP
ncbi:hypothetical protein [Pseudidiomarina sp. CB1]|uniref:hypothetical protein n=1 Tax=Pseudidiomarina sp. CB1 TaxID=2972484 RepID=UPI002163D799|nr:hypothetical protein [Pseudidiomarina sp. CB1]